MPDDVKIVPVLDAVRWFEEDRRRWIASWRSLMNNPLVSTEEKAEARLSTESAMRQIAILAGVSDA